MIQPMSMYSLSDTDGYNPVDILNNAIILQAVKDFRSARKRLKRRPDDKTANGVVKEISRFFRSDYFAELTELDGPALLRRLMSDESACERKASGRSFRSKRSSGRRCP